MPETLPQLPRAATPRRRTRGRRSWALVALLGVVALVVSACGSDSSSAVTVNGSDISESTVKTQLAAIQKNPVLKSQAAPNGKLDPAAAATWLTHLVEIEVARQGVDKAGTKITKSDKTEAQTASESFFGGAQAFSAFPKSFQDMVVARYANVPAFVRAHAKAPTDAAVRSTYESSIAKTCPSHRFVSHIVATSEASAQADVAQLAAGTDFKDLASKSSTDQQTASRGGAYGCIDSLQGQLDPTFIAAATAVPTGQVSAPVHLADGWHIIKVEDVATALPFDSVKAEIRSELTEEAPAGRKALVKAMTAAKVTVLRSLGRWQVKDGQGSVQAPTTTTTTKPGTSTTKPTTPTTSTKPTTTTKP